MSSDLFLVMPSFVQGASSVLDVAGTRELTNYRIAGSPEEADRRAMEADWRAVGADLRVALETVGGEADRESAP
jgi:hypothetical protein